MSMTQAKDILPAGHGEGGKTPTDKTVTKNENLPFPANADCGFVGPHVRGYKPPHSRRKLLWTGL